VTTLRPSPLPASRHRRVTQRARADLAALAAIIFLWAAWIALTGNRLDDVHFDQGWYLQVSARVAAGDILYRDTLWMYGPLPVYLLAGLLRLLEGRVVALTVLNAASALFGALLAYGVARTLLPARLAFLSIVAVLAAGIWGGFMGYTSAYTGAIPVGAAFGLLSLLSLLRYVVHRRIPWAVLSGAATGLAALSKPEFALATLGTGILFWGTAIVLPRAFGQPRRSSAGAAFTYFVAAAVVIAAVFAPLGSAAGPDRLLDGLTAYDQDRLVMREWPPWGNRASWAWIILGFGPWLIAGSLMALMSPAARARSSRSLLIATLLCGVALVATWIALGDVRSMQAVILPPLAGVEQFFALGRASVTLILAGCGIWALRQIASSARTQHVAAPADWVLATICAYSALAAVRSFLHPLATLHFHYLTTAVPALVYCLAYLLPRVGIGGGAPGREGEALRRGWAESAVVLALLLLIAAGITWDAAHFREPLLTLESARGQVRMADTGLRKAPWIGLIDHLAQAAPTGSTAIVITAEPGTSFFAVLGNPLPYDHLLPGMGTGPDDLRVITDSLHDAVPDFVIVGESVRNGGVWFWGLPEGAETLAAFEPVWAAIEAHYRLASELGPPGWRYWIYRRARDPAGAANIG
jgi:hypothetical protein